MHNYVLTATLDKLLHGFDGGLTEGAHIGLVQRSQLQNKPVWTANISILV